MATTQEIANSILADFDSHGSTTILRVAALAIMKLDGVTESEAAATAESKSVGLLGILRSMDPMELPFQFSLKDPNRLVGKQRDRPGETEEARAARRRLHLVSDYVDAMISLGHRCFENVSAAALELAGASQSFATGHGDEGGIDIYGRIPIRPASPLIQRSVLATSILDRDLLFLGQSKCLGKGAEVSRDEISKFNSDVEFCRQKYEGVARKPSNRVPEAYYRTGETALKVFLTTGKYAPGAITFAKASDIAIVNGRELAEFMLFHGIGLRTTDGVETVQSSLIAVWAGCGMPPTSDFDDGLIT